jgi:hypothetical protein
MKVKLHEIFRQYGLTATKLDDNIKQLWRGRRGPADEVRGQMNLKRLSEVLISATTESGTKSRSSAPEGEI